jgi:competence protein ComEC
VLAPSLRRHSLTLYLALTLALAFGARHAQQLTADRSAFSSLGLDQGRSPHVSIVGLVTSPPSVGRWEQASWFATVKVEQLSPWGGEPMAQARGRILRIRGPGTPPPVGATISAHGTLSWPAMPMNPGAGDPRLALRRGGAFAEFRPAAGSVEILATGRLPLRDLAHQAATSIESTIHHLADDPEIAPLLANMALGSRDDTPEDLEEAFRKSGTLHLFAVSGLHVGIVGLLAWFLVRRLLLLPRWGCVLAVIAMLFLYATVTGLRPSALRAATMGTMLLASMLIDRRPDGPSALAASALILLAFDPSQLFRPGFQLSFGVLLALFALGPPLYRALQPWVSQDPFLPRLLLDRRQDLALRFRRWLAALAVTSLAAWLGSAPLMLIHFHRLTPAGLVSSMILVPLAFVVLLSLTLTLSASAIAPPLAPALAAASTAVGRLVLSIALFGSSLPFGELHLSPSRPGRPSSPSLTVLSLPTSGAAAHLDLGPDLGRHRDWLVDVGSPTAWEVLVHPYLVHRKVNSLAGAFLTHHDLQHIGGTPAMLDSYSPRLLIFNPDPRSRSPALVPVDAALAASPLTARQALHAGDQISLSPSIAAHVLWPPAPPPGQPPLGRVADDRAMVIRLDAPGGTILLFSDAGFLAARHLQQFPAAIACDVIVLGRHDSDMSLTSAFIHAARPRAVIAAAHEFPREQRLSAAERAAFDQVGATLLPLSTLGAVTITFTPDGLTLAPLHGDPLHLQKLISSLSAHQR